MVKKYTNYQNKLKFLLDENMPISLIDILEKIGYLVEHVGMNHLKGKSDKEVSEYAQSNSLILVTKDKQFGSILLFPKGSHYGLFILRAPFFFKAHQINKIVSDFLKKIDNEQLIKSRTILELGKYRIRKD